MTFRRAMSFTLLGIGCFAGGWYVVLILILLWQAGVLQWIIIGAAMFFGLAALVYFGSRIVRRMREQRDHSAG